MGWDAFLANSAEASFRARVRERLIGDNAHFLHKTHEASLEGIVKRGLIAQPHTDVPVPHWVTDAGLDNNVLFFTPANSAKPMWVTGAGVLLAIPPAALPQRVGLDWTFRDALDCAAGDFKRTAPNDHVGFAVDFMTKYSSVLCYDGVAASELHRWDGDPASLRDPLAWPKLTETLSATS